jgi:hypothetical protein
MPKFQISDPVSLPLSDGYSLMGVVASEPLGGLLNILFVATCSPTGDVTYMDAEQPRYCSPTELTKIQTHTTYETNTDRVTPVMERHPLPPVAPKQDSFRHLLGRVLRRSVDSLIH